MVHGVVIERYEGTPQGGPLSPLLSNILLDELDRELERRGLGEVVSERMFHRLQYDSEVSLHSQLPEAVRELLGIG